MAKNLTFKGKVRVFSKLFVYWVLLMMIKVTGKKGKRDKKLLIIKTDGIGDYILFRNFLAPVRNYYHDYKIIYCINSLYKDLAENFDNKYFDQLICLNHKKFARNLIYRYRFLKSIQKLNVEIAFQPRFSRAFADAADDIIYVSNAHERIGGPGDLSGSRVHKMFHDSYYTKIIYGAKTILFEFYRNKEFFETLLNRKLYLQKPSINNKSFHLSVDLPANYVVIFPGAGLDFRRWATSNFAKVAEYIINEYACAVVVAGSESEINLGKEISEIVDHENLIDLTGKFNLTKFSVLLSNAALLVSNETGPVHISVAVDTPVVCISNGNHFGRFTPYPSEIFEEYYGIYPPEIAQNIGSYDKLVKKYGKGSDMKINNINVDAVNKEVDKVMQRHLAGMNKI